MTRITFDSTAHQDVHDIPYCLSCGKDLIAVARLNEEARVLSTIKVCPNWRKCWRGHNVERLAPEWVLVGTT